MRRTGAYNVGLSYDTWSGSTNRAIFAGYGNDWPLRTNDTFWYEPAAYEEFTPRNLYLAQMTYFGYPLPDDNLMPVPAPYERGGDVFRILPTDDITPGNGSDGALKSDAIYLKFNLSTASETNVAHARLRLTFSGIKNTLQTYGLDGDR